MTRAAQRLECGTELSIIFRRGSGLGRPHLSPARAVSRLSDGPYRTFDVDALLSPDADVETDVPSFATWDDASGAYAEDDVLHLLEETRDCLRDRGFNAFLAIDVGIPLDEMDAATQRIAFAQASNAVVFIAP